MMMLSCRDRDRTSRLHARRHQARDRRGETNYISATLAITSICTTFPELLALLGIFAASATDDETPG